MYIARRSGQLANPSTQMISSTMCLTEWVDFFNHDAMNALDDFNRADAADAGAWIARCCASTQWRARMVAGRPYESAAQLLTAADSHWRALVEADFLEAFRGHPKIGQPPPVEADVRADSNADSANSTNSAALCAPNATALASDEQAGATAASAPVSAALARGNARYESKFGFIFIVCASGKGGGEMLELLQGRLDHDRATEIKAAAEEQRKITALRIHKLLAGDD